MAEAAGGEDRERVMSRARLCELLQGQGFDAELDGRGDVVVRYTGVLLHRPSMHNVEWLERERQTLAAWRKTVHQAVARMCRCAWVTVKAASQPAQRTRGCGRCQGGMACLRGRPEHEECLCRCHDCDELGSHRDCSVHCAKGGFCRPHYERVLDTVRVCSAAVVQRSRINEKGAAATRAALAAETVLMARARGEGPWGRLPRDVALLIANMMLGECRLHVRRRRDEW